MASADWRASARGRSSPQCAQRTSSSRTALASDARGRAARRSARRMSHAATATSRMSTRSLPIGCDYHSQDENPGRSARDRLRMKLLAPLLAAAYGQPREEGAWPPRKILLIRRNGIGDMICALPLVRRVRAAFPRARIDMLASERNAPILAGGPLVDRVLVYRRGRGLMRNHYFNLRRFMRPVREARYDLAIAITGGFSRLVAVIAYATGVPRRVGFVPAAAGRAAAARDRVAAHDDAERASIRSARARVALSHVQRRRRDARRGGDEATGVRALRERRSRHLAPVGRAVCLCALGEPRRRHRRRAGRRATC